MLRLFLVYTWVTRRITRMLKVKKSTPPLIVGKNLILREILLLLHVEGSNYVSLEFLISIKNLNEYYSVSFGPMVIQSILILEFS